MAALVDNETAHLKAGRKTGRVGGERKETVLQQGELSPHSGSLIKWLLAPNQPLDKGAKKFHRSENVTS